MPPVAPADCTADRGGNVRSYIRAAGLLAATVLATLALAPSAHAACSSTRVTSLADLASEVGAGRSACLADGSYTGNVDLANPSATRVVVTQEGAAVVHGQMRLNSSRLELNGLAVDNPAGTESGTDCLRIQVVGGTDLRIVDSDIGPCARDAIRMAYNLGQHDTEVTIEGNTLHDAVWNACTCYMRGGLFMDNLVHDIGNDALDLWGDSNIVRHNTFRNLVAKPSSNHNDVLQTWQIPGDPATGDPLTNLVFDRNVVDTVSGPDSHGLMIQGGSANSMLTIASNLFRDIGSIGLLLDGATNVELSTNTFARAGGMDTLEWKAGASGTIDSTCSTRPRASAHSRGIRTPPRDRATPTISRGVESCSRTRRPASTRIRSSTTRAARATPIGTTTSGSARHIARARRSTTGTPRSPAG